jgi:hypothetical protein
MNQTLKIPYKSKKLILHLVLGFFYTAIGVFQIYDAENSNWFQYFWFFFGTIYLAIYFYQKTQKYITIENGIIKQNWPFGKQLKLAEITIIRHFAGEYILKNESKKELKIQINFISEESLVELKEILKSLDAKWF